MSVRTREREHEPGGSAEGKTAAEQTRSYAVCINKRAAAPSDACIGGGILV